MNKFAFRAHFDSEFKEIKEVNIVDSWSRNSPDNFWKTNHSLQLSKFGFFILKKYCRAKNINMLSIPLQNGRNISELLMLANTMDVPYFISEFHVTGKLFIQTIDSDRLAMLILNDGNIPNWANMYRND